MGILPKVITKAFWEEEIGDEDVSAQQNKIPITHKELGKIINVRISEIVPNPSQPRKHFDTAELTSLAKSISQDGIIQPLSVRRIQGGFELISGERRLRAAKIAGLNSVPCIIINLDEQRSAVLALIENIQRSDLNFFEEAEAITKLISTYNMTQEEVAVRLGFAQSTVANKLRLLKLTEEEKQIIEKNNLSERHARAVLKLENSEQRKILLMKIAEGGWTVSATEKYIRNLENENAKKTSYEKRSVMLKDVRLFFNTVNKAVNVMKMAGVNANTKRINHEDYIEYIIKIPSSDINKKA